MGIMGLILLERQKVLTSDRGARAQRAIHRLQTLRWSIRCSSVCTRRGGKRVAWTMDLDVLFFRKAPQCTFWVTCQFVRLVLCW